MTDCTGIPDCAVPSLASVLSAVDLTTAQRSAVLALVAARENAIADVLLQIGSQTGALPSFVAEAIQTVGLGTPVDAETRAHIHANFHQTINQLRQQGGTN